MLSLFILLICSACATPVKVKEKAFDFWMENTAGFGAEINSDPRRWGRLFALAPLPPQAGKQDKPRSWLGITMKLDDTAQAVESASPAIEALRVFPQSSAEMAGLQNGDRIIALDGEKLILGEENSVIAHFAKTIAGKTPGDKVLLTVRRGETRHNLTAILSPRPKSELVLKPHPDLQNIADQYPDSLMSFALKKEGLLGEYARVTSEIRERASEMMSPLVKGEGYNPFRLQEVNYVLSRPLDLPAVAHKITEVLHGAFNKERHNLTELIRVGMEELDLIYAPAQMAGKKSAGLAEYIERLVNAIARANQIRAEILSALTHEEIEILTAGAEAILREDPSELKKEKSADEKQNMEKDQELFFKTALKLDLAGLLNASALVAQAIDIDTLVELKGKDQVLNRYPNDWVVRQEENLTVIQTPAGKVLVGGKGKNIYSEEAALIIDLGGDDVYLNRAGGSSAEYPFAVVIDLSGNDLYSASADFAQGTGLLGGGFLVDLEGDDRYFARNYAQGAGIFGVGLLVDLSGNDEYKATAAVQGAGAFGIGFLAENGGNDRYFADRFAQGFGYIKGFGAIVEVSGNDHYFAGGTFPDDRQPNKAYQSMSQGFGFGMRPYETLVGASGGIGVIAEAEGNDTYTGDYFAQGASYWFALGILADKKGHDKYISGRYSQGAGIHLSAGILMDGEGDDIYLSYFGVSQGCGHDLSIGILLDNGGDDRYISGVISQGAGNDNGIGILNDNGGNDEYYIKGLGQGRGNFERGRGMGSFGFHFDTGGGDDFYSPSGKNNHLVFRTDWGIFADTK